MMNALNISLRSSLILLYVMAGLVMAAGIAVLAAGKGLLPLAIYLALLLVFLAAWLFRPGDAFILLLAMAPLFGWTFTSLPGFNLSLMGGVLSFAAALSALRWHSSGESDLTITEQLAAGFSGLIFISTLFAAVRMSTFELMRQAGITEYAVNPLSISNIDVLHHVFSIAAVLFSLFGLLLAARSAWRHKWLPGVLTGVMAAMLAVMLYQKFADPYFLLPRGFPPEFRLNGTTSYAYALGAFLLLSFAALPALFRKKLLPWLLATVVCSLPVILWSGSRLALLFCLFFLLVYGGLFIYSAWQAGKRIPWKVLGLSAAVLAVAVILVVFYIQQLDESGEGSALSRLVKHVGKDGFIGHFQRTRLNAYPLALNVIGAYPLTGTGVGTYYAEVTKQLPLLMPADYVLSDRFNLRSNAPNHYLALATDAGMPVMILFVALWLAAVFSGWHRFRAAADGAHRFQLMCLLAAAVTLMAGFIIGPELYNAEAMPLAALILAALGGAEGAVKQQRPRLFWPLWLNGGLAAVLIAGCLFSYQQLSLDRQWQQLGWYIDKGFYGSETGGRWTGSYAAWVIERKSAVAELEWYCGAAEAEGYQPEVRFFVDGDPAIAPLHPQPGEMQHNYLHLPENGAGYNIIEVEVSPAFVPADYGTPGDRRPLGIHLQHSRVAASGELLGALSKPLGRGQRQWMGRRAAIHLRPGSSELVLFMRSGHPDLAGRTASLEIRLNGSQFTVVTFDDDKRLQEAVIPLPEDQWNAIELVADRTYRPASFDLSDDNRDLSFQISFAVR